jgi:quinohemoprotein ethanol dehydrogenase
VIQGDTRGIARAFAADTGRVLWSMDLRSAVQSAPVTYLHRGEQYVLFLTGLGGSARFGFASLASPGPSRAIALRIGGTGEIPPWIEPPLPRPVVLYGAGWCVICHGFSGRNTAVSLYPDLRRINKATHDGWLDIVRHGARAERGMPAFGEYLDDAQALAIRDYLVHVAWRDHEKQQRDAAVGARTRRARSRRSRRCIPDPAATRPCRPSRGRSPPSC